MAIRNDYENAYLASMVDPYKYVDVKPLSPIELRSLGINPDTAYIEDDCWETRTYRCCRTNY